MTILIVLIAASAAVAIVAAVRTVLTDGYHKVPTRLSAEESSWSSH